jgi:hypothetical protein
MDPRQSERDFLAERREQTAGPAEARGLEEGTRTLPRANVTVSLAIPEEIICSPLRVASR